MILRPRSATFRYRVGDLTHAWKSADRAGGSLQEVKEFRTLKAANRYGAELTKRGGNALLQVGLVQWMAPEDASVAMLDLIATGVELDGN